MLKYLPQIDILYVSDMRDFPSSSAGFPLSPAPVLQIEVYSVYTIHLTSIPGLDHRFSILLLDFIPNIGTNYSCE